MWIRIPSEYFSCTKIQKTWGSKHKRTEREAHFFHTLSFGSPNSFLSSLIPCHIHTFLILQTVHNVTLLHPFPSFDSWTDISFRECGSTQFFVSPGFFRLPLSWRRKTSGRYLQPSSGQFCYQSRRRSKQGCRWASASWRSRLGSCQNYWWVLCSYSQRSLEKHYYECGTTRGTSIDLL